MLTPTPSRHDRWIRAGFLALIIAGFFIAAFFSLRTVRSYVRLRNTGLQPGTSDVEAIRGWMTIPYIAAAYAAPPEYIFAALTIPPAGNEAKSLSQLNQEYAPEQRGYILAQVKDALRRYQTEHPPTPSQASP